MERLQHLKFRFIYFWLVSFIIMVSTRYNSIKFIALKLALIRKPNNNETRNASDNYV